MTFFLFVILGAGAPYSLSAWGYKYCHYMAFFFLSSWVWCVVLTISLCHPGRGVPAFFVILGLDPRIQVL